MLREQNISQHVCAEEPWRSHHHGSSAGRFPLGRPVVVILGVLDALLLLAAIVIGIYCAKTTDLQVPGSTASPFIIHLNYLTSNHSNMIRERLQVLAEILQERSKHMQLMLQLKQNKMVTDLLQKQIETLHTEKSALDQNITVLEKSCGGCLPGWSLFASSCYYFSNEDSIHNKNWADSRADCKSKGADLVVIDNLEEQDFVNNRFPTLGSFFLEWQQNGFWIGLTHVAATPGVWMWVNNVTVTEAPYWISGQPNYQGPTGGNCSASSPHTGNYRKTWYSADCQNTQLRYVCETRPIS